MDGSMFPAFHSDTLNRPFQRRMIPLWRNRLSVLAAIVALAVGSASAAGDSPPWEGQFDWDQVPDLYDGLRHASVSVSSPRLMVLHVLRVDTSNPDIRFHTGGRHPDWGEPMPEFPQYRIRAGRQTTRDFLQANRQAGRNMVAAINAAPWGPWGELSDQQKLEYRYADRMGLTVSEGTLVDFGNNRPSFVMFKDWTVGMRDSPLGTDVSRIATAVSGFQFVLTSGTAVGQNTDPQPRTGYGLCADNRFALFMTIDGRQSGYSDGATHREVGYWLRHFGSHTGINMDGGGSTTLLTVNPANNALVLRNRPSTRFLWFPIERANGNNLGIYYITEPEPVPFEDWLAARGVPAGKLVPDADPGGGGLPNLLAYLLNVHPLEGRRPDDLFATPSFHLQESGELIFEFRVNRHATGLDYRIEGTDTLLPGSWEEPQEMEILPLDPDPLTNDPRYQVRIPPGEASRLFVRLAVDLTAP